MEVVCKDTEANGDPSVWFYDAGFYTRRDSKGAAQGIIAGNQIPNPEELWKARCEAVGKPYPCDSIQNPQTGSVKRIKPADATFALWNHWQKESA